MHEEAQVLRQALAECAEGKAARSVRYGRQLRDRVIDFVHGHGDEVRSVAEAARVLGVKPHCLYRWLRAEKPASAARLRAVELVPEEILPGAVLVSPAGWRIEGLNLNILVALLRTLP